MELVQHASINLRSVAPNMDGYVPLELHIVRYTRNNIMYECSCPDIPFTVGGASIDEAIKNYRNQFRKIKEFYESRTSTELITFEDCKEQLKYSAILAAI